MTYHLTAEDVATLSGGGLTTWSDPLLTIPEGRSPVLMHVLDLAMCLDGEGRDVVVSSILVASSSREDREAIADDTYLAQQVAQAFMRDLAATGIYAYPDPVPYSPVTGGARVSQYVETCVPRDGLNDHVRAGSTWTDVLTETLTRATEGE